MRHRESGVIAAAKVAPIPSEDKLLDFAQEVNILNTVKHRNITNFIAGYYFENNLWIIIELAAGGSIADIMRKINGPLSEPQIRCSALQLLSAIDYLHKHFVIHRDMNASNVLLAEGGVVKIADFGVSAMGKNDKLRRTSFIGSPNWMAPEVIVCENDRSKPYDNKCDIWSLSITLIEFAEVRVPYHDLHPMKVLFKITSGAPPTLTEPSKWSPEFSAFLKASLVRQADKRPTAEELMGHSFCKGSSDTAPLVKLLQDVC